MKLEEINRIRECLKKAPEVDQHAKEISKLDAVRMMSSEISMMFEKGYSLEQISDLMSQEGFKIAGSTLKSYLNKTKRTKTRTKKITKKTEAQLKKNEKKAGTASFVPNNDTDEI